MGVVEGAGWERRMRWGGKEEKQEGGRAIREE